MGQRVVRFSDLTNKIIEDDEVAKIVIEQHPDLQDGPVEIEASRDEVEHLLGTSLNVVSLKIFMGDGSAPETVTMEVEAFNKLTEMEMADVIRRAQPAYPPRKQTKPVVSADRLDYASLKHAGKPHRGRPRTPRKRSSATILTRLTSGLREMDSGPSGSMMLRW
jgi:hypothetical protein